MKLTNLICAFVLAATASTFATEAGPKKMNGKLEIVEANPADVFYTGKPYEEDLGGYVFNYRTYSPEINRWTTPDPSGFLDGANNGLFISNAPTFRFDDTGLKGKSIAWVYWAPAFGPVLAGGLQKIITLNIQQMNTADQAQGSKTHYLDDGDVFQKTLIITNDANSILAAGREYERVFLFAHGNYYTTGQWAGQYFWGSDSKWFDSSTLSSASNIWYGTCFNGYSPQPTNGTLEEIQVVNMTTWASDFTKKYLLE
jgi:RHS repeat-associated protein